AFADRNQRDALRLQDIAQREELMKVRRQAHAGSGDNTLVVPQYIGAMDVDRDGPLMAIGLRDREQLVRENAVPTFALIQEVDRLHAASFDAAVDEFVPEVNLERVRRL